MTDLISKSEHKRIFISYARRDGADLACRLQTDLTAGFEVRFSEVLDNRLFGDKSSVTP